LSPWLCVIAHVVALAMLAAVLRHGGVNEPDASVRAQYIATHSAAWTLGWTTWMIAAATLVGFYAWWGSRLRANNIAIVAVVVTAVGMVFDFSGEGLLTLLLVERATSTGELDAAFGGVERAFVWLSGGVANGLYTAGGAMLTLVTPDLPALVRGAMWTTWLAGATMTVAAILNSATGMVVSTLVLFPLLLAWMTWMAAEWRRA
jgi:hypothetical protein